MGRSAPVVLIACLALALPACGDDEENERAGTAGTAGTTAEETQPRAAGPVVASVGVTETEFKLDPANPSIDETGVVEFRVKNEGSTVHALEIETAKGEFETEEIQPGGAATLKAQLDRGTYIWYCPVGNHRELGMAGKVEVAGGGPVQSESQDVSPEGDEPGSGAETGG
jgi:uncharacterized cupredoxin-like copper-binding protein